MGKTGLKSRICEFVFMYLTAMAPLEMAAGKLATAAIAVEAAVLYSLVVMSFIVMAENSWDLPSNY